MVVGVSGSESTSPVGRSVGKLIGLILIARRSIGLFAFGALPFSRSLSTDLSPLLPFAKLTEGVVKNSGELLLSESALSVLLPRRSERLRLHTALIRSRNPDLILLLTQVAN